MALLTPSGGKLPVTWIVPVELDGVLISHYVPWTLVCFRPSQLADRARGPCHLGVASAGSSVANSSAKGLRMTLAVVVQRNCIQSEGSSSRKDRWNGICYVTIFTSYARRCWGEENHDGALNILLRRVIQDCYRQEMLPYSCSAATIPEGTQSPGVVPVRPCRSGDHECQRGVPGAEYRSHHGQKRNT
jgi:hypothetical protein